MTRIVVVTSGLLAMIPLLVPLLAAHGCCSGDDCGETKKPARPKLAFVTLPNSWDIAEDDDDPTTPASEVAVRVILLNDDDSGFDDVTIANSASGASFAADFDSHQRATVLVRLDGGPAGDLDNTLTAVSENDDGDAISVSALLSVTGVEPDPLPPSCFFVSPSEGALLTALTTPVSFACSGGDPENRLQQDALHSGTVVLTSTDEDDAAGQTVLADLVGGAGSTTVAFPWSGVWQLTLTLADPDAAFSAPLSDTLSLTVDAPVLGVRVEGPVQDQVYGADDDLDGDLLNGVSLALTGTAAEADLVSFSVQCDDGNPARVGGSDDGAVDLAVLHGTTHYSATLEGLAGTNCTVTVSAQRDGAPEGGASVTFSVDAPIPAFTIAPDNAPSGGAGIFIVDDDSDGGSVDVMDLPFSITPQHMPEGASAHLVLENAFGVELVDLELGAALDDAPLATVLALPFSDEASYRLTVVPRVGGNDGVASVATFTVDTHAPEVVFASPAADAVLDAAFDESTDAGFQLTLMVSVVDASVATAVIRVDDSLQLGCSGAGGCGAQFSLSDGAHTATATVTDRAGNSGIAPDLAFSCDSTPP